MTPDGGDEEDARVGRDAGREDAGGSRDAGGRRDAGRRDAGERDSGGEEDADVGFDAGHDAGLFDAGSPDAHNPDIFDAGDGFVTMYLSDTDWAFSEQDNGWGPLERDRSNGEFNANDGRNPLRIGGVSYSRGLGVHSYSEVIVYLARNCTSFTASIGIDDEAGNNGDVVFEVWLDDEREFRSSLIPRGQAPTPIDIKLDDINIMRLVVTEGDGDRTDDHADWADAKMTCIAGWTGGG